VPISAPATVGRGPGICTLYSEDRESTDRSAGDFARSVGFTSRHQLARLLRREGLPDLEQLGALDVVAAEGVHRLRRQAEGWRDG